MMDFKLSSFSVGQWLAILTLAGVCLAQAIVTPSGAQLLNTSNGQRPVASGQAGTKTAAQQQQQAAPFFSIKDGKTSARRIQQQQQQQNRTGSSEGDSRMLTTATGSGSTSATLTDGSSFSAAANWRQSTQPQTSTVASSLTSGPTDPPMSSSAPEVADSSMATGESGNGEQMSNQLTGSNNNDLSQQKLTMSQLIGDDFTGSSTAQPSTGSSSSITEPQQQQQLFVDQQTGQMFAAGNVGEQAPGNSNGLEVNSLDVQSPKLSMMEPQPQEFSSPSSSSSSAPSSMSMSIDGMILNSRPRASSSPSNQQTESIISNQQQPSVSGGRKSQKTAKPSQSSSQIQPQTGSVQAKQSRRVPFSGVPFSSPATKGQRTKPKASNQMGGSLGNGVPNMNNFFATGNQQPAAANSANEQQPQDQLPANNMENFQENSMNQRQLPAANQNNQMQFRQQQQFQPTLEQMQSFGEEPQQQVKLANELQPGGQQQQFVDTSSELELMRNMMDSEAALSGPQRKQVINQVTNSNNNNNNNLGNDMVMSVMSSADGKEQRLVMIARDTLDSLQRFANQQQPQTNGQQLRQSTKTRQPVATGSSGQQANSRQRPAQATSSAEGSSIPSSGWTTTTTTQNSDLGQGVSGQWTQTTQTLPSVSINTQGVLSSTLSPMMNPAFGNQQQQEVQLQTTTAAPISSLAPITTTTSTTTTTTRQPALISTTTTQLLPSSEQTSTTEAASATSSATNGPTSSQANSFSEVVVSSLPKQSAGAKQQNGGRKTGNGKSSKQQNGNGDANSSRQQSGAGSQSRNGNGSSSVQNGTGNGNGKRKGSSSSTSQKQQTLTNEQPNGKRQQQQKGNKSSGTKTNGNGTNGKKSSNGQNGKRQQVTSTASVKPTNGQQQAFTTGPVTQQQSTPSSQSQVKRLTGSRATVNAEDAPMRQVNGSQRPTSSSSVSSTTNEEPQQQQQVPITTTTTTTSPVNGNGRRQQVTQNQSTPNGVTRASTQSTTNNGQNSGSIRTMDISELERKLEEMERDQEEEEKRTTTSGASPMAATRTGSDGSGTRDGGAQQQDSGERQQVTGDRLDGLRASIPGEPLVDYPIHASPPKTSFNCMSQSCPGGYYADIETQCQVFHICQNDGRFDTFLCPNGTIFSQQHFVCVWWWQVDCQQSPSFYKLNDGIYCNSMFPSQATSAMSSPAPQMDTNSISSERASGSTSGQSNAGSGMLGSSNGANSQVQRQQSQRINPSSTISSNNNSLEPATGNELDESRTSGQAQQNSSSPSASSAGSEASAGAGSGASATSSAGNAGQDMKLQRQNEDNVLGDQELSQQQQQQLEVLSRRA